MHNINFDALLTERELARKLNVSIGTVRRWRLLRTGVSYIKLGACVRYRPEDLREYIDSLASPKEAA